MKFQHAVLSALCVVSLTGYALAGPPATQKYTVIVPSNISVTAPSDVSITHDQTDADQSFPSQQWTVRGNGTSGVTVSFAAQSPFTHATDATFKRDARLSLSLAGSQGPGAWTILQPSASTDYAGGSNVATVQASSNGVGRATFNLNVAFLTNSFGTFAAGNYQTTVTGTVTQN